MGLFKKIIKSLDTPTFKGKRGEISVSHILGSSNSNDNYFVVNNYKTILNEQTIQIDHIVICNNYVLCIETKNYKGNIYGSIHSQEWTSYYYNGEKHKFYNPIIQNQNHIKAIKTILNGKDYKIMNIVVFVGQCNISKIKYNEIYDKPKLKAMIQYIKSTPKNTIANDIYKKMLSNYVEFSNKEHIQNIKNNK